MLGAGGARSIENGAEIVQQGISANCAAMTAPDRPTLAPISIAQMAEAVETEATRVAKLRKSGVRDVNVDRHFYALNSAAALIRAVERGELIPKVERCTGAIRANGYDLHCSYPAHHAGSCFYGRGP